MPNEAQPARVPAVTDRVAANPSRSEVFRSYAAGIQSIGVLIGLLMGGGWALFQWRANYVAQEAADKEQVRRWAHKPKLDVSLSAKKLQVPKGAPRYIEVEATIGSKSRSVVSVEILGKNTRFYLSRVVGIQVDGDIEYAETRMFRAAYRDKNIEFLELRPGDEPRRLHSVQRVETPGLYLVRIAIPDGERGIDAVNGAEEFLYVD